MAWVEQTADKACRDYVLLEDNAGIPVTDNRGRYIVLQAPTTFTNKLDSASCRDSPVVFPTKLDSSSCRNP